MDVRKVSLLVITTESHIKELLRLQPQRVCPECPKYVKSQNHLGWKGHLKSSSPVISLMLLSPPLKTRS